MNELERLKYQHQTERQWGELLSKLKELWGPDYESRAYYSRRVLDQVGPELMAKLATLPLSTQIHIAGGFARSGAGVGLPVEDAIFAAEQIASPTSRYRGPRSNDAEEQELHNLSKELVGEFFGSMPDGQQPADPTEPAAPAGAEPSPEAKEAARKLMDTKGPYFNKAHVDHEAVRARVQGLLAGTIAPEASAQTTPQPPAAGPAGGDTHE